MLANALRSPVCLHGIGLRSIRATLNTFNTLLWCPRLPLLYRRRQTHWISVSWKCIPENGIIYKHNKFRVTRRRKCSDSVLYNSKYAASFAAMMRECFQGLFVTVAANSNVYALTCRTWARYSRTHTHRAAWLYGSCMQWPPSHRTRNRSTKRTCFHCCRNGARTLARTASSQVVSVHVGRPYSRKPGISIVAWLRIEWNGFVLVVACSAGARKRPSTFAAVCGCVLVWLCARIQRQTAAVSHYSLRLCEPVCVCVPIFKLLIG